MKRKIHLLRKLHRVERTLWIVIIVCLFMLFKMGIDIEYEHISKVWINVLHTITVVITIVSSTFQGLVVSKTYELESEVFNNDER